MNHSLTLPLYCTANSPAPFFVSIARSTRALCLRFSIEVQAGLELIRQYKALAPLVLPKIAQAIRESNFDNYRPPRGQRIDHGQMNDDLRRGVSVDAVKAKTVQGKYNIPDDICK